MSRGPFILVAYLMLGLPFTLALSVAQDLKQASQPHTAPNQTKDNLTDGTYLVIGVFRKLSFANRLKKLHHKFTPKVVTAKSKGNPLYRVVIGPLKKNNKNLTRKALLKAGIKEMWQMQVGSRSQPAGKQQSASGKRKPKSDRLGAPGPTRSNPKGKPLAGSNKEKPTVSKTPTKQEAEKRIKLSSPKIRDFKPGDKFSDCESCPEMVVIPPGKFIMGEEGGGMTGDAPATSVTISKSIAIGRFEITFDQWDACVEKGGCNSYTPSDEGWGRSTQPVMNVNWNDAWTYAAWLSVRTGQFYRLPSEAEWEYAARAGTNTKYWWGEEIGNNRAVCQNCGSIYDDKKAAPVGTFSPNKFGLFDMTGNLWEWTQDCYSSNAYQKHSNYPKAFPGANNCSHVLRGGGWDVIAAGIQSSFRFTSGASNRTTYFGFRVVRELQ